MGRSADGAGFHKGSSVEVDLEPLGAGVVVCGTVWVGCGGGAASGIAVSGGLREALTRGAGRRGDEDDVGAVSGRWRPKPYSQLWLGGFQRPLQSDGESEKRSGLKGLVS